MSVNYWNALNRIRTVPKEEKEDRAMSPHSHCPHYLDLSKSKRKDALVPDPQEYDMSDHEQSKITPLSAKARLKVFERLVCSIQGV